MAKKKDATATDAADLGAATDLDFSVPQEMNERLEEVKVGGEMPCFQPGQEGFMPGKTLSGYYLGTKRVYSNKFNNPKIEKGTGRKYRDLHNFRHPQAGLFGIWAVGVTAFVLRNVKKGVFVAITYDGLGEAPLKKGQSKPHLFTFKGEGVQIDTNRFQDIYEMEDAAAAAGANAHTGEVLDNEAMPS